MLGTLDRYVVRSFLYCYFICFLVLMGLRVVADLFVNMDEFAELGLSFGGMTFFVTEYYAYQSLLYFRELSGVIVVAGAAFSLARMNHTNELTAMLASGVSLYRVVAPILLVALVLSGLAVVNQELLIPQAKDHLVRSPDKLSGSEQFKVYAMTDAAGSVWYSPTFRMAGATMDSPVVVLRDVDGQFQAAVAGGVGVYRAGEPWRILPWADGRQATLTRAYANSVDSTFLVHTALRPDDLQPQDSPDTQAATAARPPRLVGHDEAVGITIKTDAVEIDETGMRLVRPVFVFYALPDPLASGEAPAERPRVLARISAAQAAFVVLPDQGNRAAYELTDGAILVESELTPQEMLLRKEGEWLDYMSSGELGDVLDLDRVTDRRQVLLTRHIRFTEPAGHVLLLMIGLPFILSRERNIKASAGLCVLVVAVAYLFMFLSRYLGDYVNPALAAWLPLLVLGPIAVMRMGELKT